MGRATRAGTIVWTWCKAIGLYRCNAEWARWGMGDLGQKAGRMKMADGHGRGEKESAFFFSSV